MDARKIRSTPEVVAEHLRDLIFRNELHPGQQLAQEEIARLFGISRIPVRDALRQLQGEGLVELYPNRGAFVASPDLTELRELFALRILVETYALCEAIPHYTKSELAHCSSLLTQLEAAEARSDWARLDRAVHAALYAPCRLERTLAMVENLRGVVTRYYFLYLTPDSHNPACLQEHRRIFRAYKRRDPEAAARALGQHLRNALAAVQASAAAASAPSNEAKAAGK